MNNWLLVKLCGSRVSRLSMSLFRVSGWRGKSKLLMRITHHVPALNTHPHPHTHLDKLHPHLRCRRCKRRETSVRPLKHCSFTLFLAYMTSGWWRNSSRTMRGRCLGTVWSPLRMTVSPLACFYIFFSFYDGSTLILCGWDDTSRLDLQAFTGKKIKFLHKYQHVY